MHPTLLVARPRHPRAHRWLPLPLTLSLIASLLAAALGGHPARADGSAGAAGVVGSFEIDGNKADDSGAGEPIDWDTPPPNLTDFPDLSNSSADDSFGGGSKQLEPGNWTCVQQKVPAKTDLESGQLAFRTLDGDQFLYANWIRRAEQGDAHIGYEFNQSSQPNPNCPDVPQRTDGDLLVTFDTDQGGKSIDVNFFRWRFTGAGIGVFDEIDVGEKHVNWDGAVNIPPEKSPPGLDPGTFGELSLNLTAALGRPIACGEFSSAYVKSRASSEENAALKDFIAPKRVNIGQCPDSELHKSVRNVSDGEAFGADPETPSSTTAAPGDEIAYRLTYHNHGTAPATNVTIADEVPEHSTLVSCTPDCGAAPGSGPGTQVTWTFASVPADGSEVVTFQVQLDSTFPEGTTEITNVATATTDDDSDESNPTTVTVSAAADIGIDKRVPAGAHQVGDTVTVEIDVTNSGNADATVDVTDDYDQDHVDITNVSSHGTSQDDDGDIITWFGVEVPAGQTVTLSYDATFKGPFLDEPGGDGCDGTNSEFPVSNTASANGASDTETTCVIAEPAFTVTKTVSDDTADLGQTVTYTITVENIGDATGTVDVTDDYDELHVEVSNIQPPPTTHDTVNGIITWADRTLDPGDTQVFSYDASFEGVFLTDPDPEECPSDERFAVINTVTVDGTQATETACVRAEAGFTVEKTASPDSAQVGDTITYTITVTNNGDASGSTTVTDDYDQDHLDVDDTSIDPPADTHDEINGTITWTSMVLDPSESQDFIYDATIVGTFTGDSGPCPDGQFPVVNIVTVEGDDDSETVCVTPNPPDLTIAKDSDATEVTAGDLIIYTITFGNDGGATATDVTITDEHGSDVEFVSCTGPTGVDGDCERLVGNKIRWHVGDVGPGETGSVTVTFRVTDNVGCVLCDTVTVTAGNADPESFQLCVDAVPVPRPDLANARDSAFGAHATVRDLLGVITLDTTLVPVHSEQSGVGSDTDDDQILSASIANPTGLLGGGDLLTAEVLTTTSASTVSEQPPAARHTSTSEVVDLDILNGLVTADLVRGVASTEATGSSAAFSSVGSTFVNLHIDRDLDGEVDPDEVFADVTPNTRVDLPLLCSTCYVELYQRVGSTTTPQPGQLSGGTYAADLKVNMIHAHLRDVLGNVIDVRVANAKAHSDFPQTTLCEDQPVQAVSGHAFVLSALTDPSLVPTVVGFTSIPATGGFDHQNLAQAGVPADGSLAQAGASVSETQGQLDPDSSQASAYAETADVCLLRDPSGQCTVEATVARAESNSSADNTSGATTNDGDGDGDDDTIVAEVRVLGEVVAVDPAPNTVINLLGIGFLVLNEQFCDNNGTLANDCADGDVAGHAGRTIRALRLVLLDPASGGLPGAEVIVAEAHSDARFE